MLNIKQQFIMTEDAIPINVKPGRWKQCNRCKRLAKRIVKGLCNRCEVYLHISGRDRPKRLFNTNTLCKNVNCRRALKNDANSNAGKCNACYRYYRRVGVDRPRKLIDK
jgi:hypothetical protein